MRIWVEFAANGGVIEDITPAQRAELLTIGNITTSFTKYWTVLGDSKFADLDYFEREIVAVYFEKPDSYGESLVFRGEGNNTKPHPRYSSVVVPDDFVVPPDLLPFGEQLIEEALDSLEDALRARGLSRVADLVEQSRDAASLREVIKEQVTAHTELLDEALNGSEAFNEAEYEAASRAIVRNFWNDLGDELGDDSIPLALGDGLTSQLGWGNRGDELLRVVRYDEPLQLWNEIDAAVGGSGNDVIYAQSEFGQTVLGAAGDDTIKSDLFDHAPDRFYGGSGDDSIESFGGVDDLYGGSGHDELGGGWGSHSIDGGAGNDEIISSDGVKDEDFPDVLAGGSGDDRIRLSAYKDNIYGGSGRDRFVIDHEFAFVDTGQLPVGVQVFEGALIWDLETSDVIEVEGRRLDRPARYVESQATGAGIELVVDGQAMMLNTFLWALDGFHRDLLSVRSSEIDDEGEVSTEVRIALVRATGAAGSSGTDVLVGDADWDAIDETGGLDTLQGLGGDDRLYGLRAGDRLYGGDGNDRLMASEGNDLGYGGNANDYITGGEDSDRLFGGSGIDRVSGDAGSDSLFGGNESDSLSGGDDSDRLYGGGGNDRLFGGTANDRIDGGEGNDVALGSDGNDIVVGAAGNDSLFGGNGIDRLFGGTGIDTLFGGEGSDSLAGDETIDRAFGGADNDRLFGGEASDSLYGGEGNDLIDGGAGNDRLSGGAGNDLFVIQQTAGNQVILDLVAGEDRLDLRAFAFAAGDDVRALASALGSSLALTLPTGSTLLLNGLADPAGLVDGALLL